MVIAHHCRAGLDSLATCRSSPSACTMTHMIYSLHCMIHCMSTYIFTVTLTVYIYCTTGNKHAYFIMYMYIFVLLQRACTDVFFSVNAATCRMYSVCDVYTFNH